MADDLKPGDVVVLKSGGPAMTVLSVKGGVHQCAWFNGNDGREGNFPAAALERTTTGTTRGSPTGRGR